MSGRRAVFLGVAAACITGCSGSLSVMSAVGVDSRGELGTEGRFAGHAGLGAQSLRLRTGMEVGGGYSERLRSLYVLTGAEVGVEGGQDAQWAVGGLYSLRGVVARQVELQHAVGIAAQATFAFVRLPRERGRLFLGPRLSAEAVIDTRGNTAATEGVELYHLWLVVRWVTFDDSIGR